MDLEIDDEEMRAEYSDRQYGNAVPTSQNRAEIESPS